MASNKFRFATFYFFTWIALASEIDSGSKSPVAYFVYRSTFRATIRQNVRAGMSHTESLATYPTCTQIIIHYDIINIEKSRFCIVLKTGKGILGRNQLFFENMQSYVDFRGMNNHLTPPPLCQNILYCRMLDHPSTKKKTGEKNPKQSCW